MGKRHVVRNILFLGPVLLALAGCGAKKGLSPSSVSVQFPSASSARGPAAYKVGSFDWSLACFSVNVTANDIGSTRPNCAPPVGVFTGSVAPGGALTLSVPNGSRRQLEIYAFIRTSTAQPCPALSPSTGLVGLDLSKTVRLTSTIAATGSNVFDSLTADVNLDVQLAQPTGTTDVVEQYGLAAACRPANAVGGPGGSRIVLGSAVSSNASYAARGSLSGRSNEAILQNGTYKAVLTRESF